MLLISERQAACRGTVAGLVLGTNRPSALRFIGCREDEHAPGDAGRPRRGHSVCSTRTGLSGWP